MTDYYEYSTPELVRLLGRRFREFRMQADLTQKDVAHQTGLTVATIYKFEKGVATNISLGTFLLLLKSIGQIDAIDNVLPELPESPYLYKQEKKVQRIRHKKEVSV